MKTFVTTVNGERYYYEVNFENIKAQNYYSIIIYKQGFQKKENNRLYFHKLQNISENKKFTYDLAKFLCENLVMPIHCQEIVEELLSSNPF